MTSKQWQKTEDKHVRVKPCTTLLSYPQRYKENVTVKVSEDMLICNFRFMYIGQFELK